MKMIAKVQLEDEKYKPMIEEILKDMAGSIPQVYDGWLELGIPLTIIWKNKINRIK